VETSGPLQACNGTALSLQRGESSALCPALPFIYTSNPVGCGI
jgi:hypothetical protein